MSQRALTQRGCVGAAAGVETVGLGFEERIAVLSEAAAGGDEQRHVSRDRLEERLIQLERERRRVANQIRIIVTREDIAGRRQRVRDRFHRHGLERAAGRQGKSSRTHAGAAEQGCWTER